MDRGLTRTAAPHAPAEASLPSKLASLVRYRFFLYAGLLPYLLGAAWAYGVERQFNAGIFWLGFLGIFLSVVGVESFNEYFDARMGTDRVFNPSDDEYIPEWMFWLGVGAFAVAATIGFYLAWKGGWPIAVYTLLGGLAAIFYVGPPIRWVYRGLGETAIGLSYGPWMTLGSLELYTHRFSWPALAASLVPGFLITGLAVVNEIPDFYQDRLVGKRNLVVRLGRRNGVFLYAGFAALGLLTPCVGAWAGIFPRWTPLAALAGFPLLILSVKHALKTWDSPRNFIPAIKYVVLCYLAATLVFTLAVLAP
ncbi:MAG TPA: prenyltransferase [Elusimicrobiota bacterium]|nr:prenyltransferase [Elusimicrobiota bacterium]